MLYISRSSCSPGPEGDSTAITCSITKKSSKGLKSPKSLLSPQITTGKQEAASMVWRPGNPSSPRLEDFIRLSTGLHTDLSWVNQSGLVNLRQETSQQGIVPVSAEETTWALVAEKPQRSMFLVLQPAIFSLSR